MHHIVDQTPSRRLLWNASAARRLLTHLRQAVDSRGAAGDAGQANGPRYEVDSEAAETLHAAFFTFITDGVGQQLLMEE